MSCNAHVAEKWWPYIRRRDEWHISQSRIAPCATEMLPSELKIANEMDKHRADSCLAARRSGASLLPRKSQLRLLRT